MRSWFRIAKWPAIIALLIGANIFFYSAGFSSGQYDGAQRGITVTLDDVAHRGFGEWVVIGTREEDGRPDTKFRWFDGNQCPPPGLFKMRPDTERSILKPGESTHVDDPI